MTGDVPSYHRVGYAGGMSTPIGETGSKPAPGRLALVQAFINTLDLETERDALATPDGLGAWLGSHCLLAPGAAVSQDERERAVAVREALRRLLLVNAGLLAVDETRADRAVLADTAARCPLIVHLDDDGATHLEPAVAGVDGALAVLLAAVHDARLEGAWSRLKACRNDRCHWAFYDHSKNRSGTWCTMAVCGSRLKSRAYRERQAVGDARSRRGSLSGIDTDVPREDDRA